MSYAFMVLVRRETNLSISTPNCLIHKDQTQNVGQFNLSDINIGFARKRDDYNEIMFQAAEAGSAMAGTLTRSQTGSGTSTQAPQYNPVGLEVPFLVNNKEKWISGIVEETTCGDVVKVIYPGITVLNYIDLRIYVLRYNK